MPHVLELRQLRTLAAAAAVATIALAGCTESPRRTPVTGTATGEVVAGVPVYRLPAIEVVGHRPREFARAGPAPRAATGVGEPRRKEG